MFNLHEYLYLMLGSLLGYNLIVLVPLIVLTVKMPSAPPHTLLPVIIKPLPYTSGYIHYRKIHAFLIRATEDQRNCIRCNVLTIINTCYLRVTVLVPGMMAMAIVVRARPCI